MTRRSVVFSSTDVLPEGRHGGRRMGSCLAPIRSDVRPLSSKLIPLHKGAAAIFGRLFRWETMKQHARFARSATRRLPAAASLPPLHVPAHSARRYRGSTSRLNIAVNITAQHRRSKRRSKPPIIAVQHRGAVSRFSIGSTSRLNIATRHRGTTSPIDNAYRYLLSTSPIDIAHRNRLSTRLSMPPAVGSA